MLSRAHRFHGLNSLNYVYRQGQSVRGGQIALRYCHNSRRRTFRAAVVVSKKVHKSAVNRNRVRRRIYGVLDQVAAEITQPYDFIFTVFSDQVLGMSPALLRQTVLEQLQKAKSLDRSETS